MTDDLTAYRQVLLETCRVHFRGRDAPCMVPEPHVPVDDAAAAMAEREAKLLYRIAEAERVFDGMPTLPSIPLGYLSAWRGWLNSVAAWKKQHAARWGGPMIDPDVGLLRDRAVRLAAEHDRAIAAAKELRAALGDLARRHQWSPMGACVCRDHQRAADTLANTAWLEDR